MGIMNNSDKEKEYINQLVQMKRYIRSDTKFEKLVEEANKKLELSDYAYEWKLNREKLVNYLKDYFQLLKRGDSKISVKKVEGSNGSYTVDIKITNTPIKPKYCVGTTNTTEYKDLWSAPNEITIDDIVDEED